MCFSDLCGYRFLTTIIFVLSIILWGLCENSHCNCGFFCANIYHADSPNIQQLPPPPRMHTDRWPPAHLGLNVTFSWELRLPGPHGSHSLCLSIRSQPKVTKGFRGDGRHPVSQEPPVRCSSAHVPAVLGPDVSGLRHLHPVRWPLSPLALTSSFATQRCRQNSPHGLSRPAAHDVRFKATTEPPPRCWPRGFSPCGFSRAVAPSTGWAPADTRALRRRLQNGRLGLGGHGENFK